MKKGILLFCCLFLSMNCYAAEDDIMQCCSMRRVVGKCEDIDVSRCKNHACVTKKCNDYVDDYQQFCTHARKKAYRCDSLSTLCEPIC